MKFFYLLLLLNVVIEGKYFKCNKYHSCGCGADNVEINARIMYGEEAIPYSWSMMVSIRFELFFNGNYFQHVCVGTILTDSHILTAVSCLETVRTNTESANVTIAAGIHRLSQPIQIIRKVDQIIVHPDWTNTRRNDYDIAVLHLSEPLNFHMNPLISRTCFSSQLNHSEDLRQYPPSNTTLAVAGWGRSSSFELDSDLLRQTILLSMDSNDTNCANELIDSTRQFCTRFHGDGTGPCYGDFGGPIFQWMNDHWEQIGIASSTSDFCNRDSVVVYTRLAYYHDWIEEHIYESLPETTATITNTPTTHRPSETFFCDKRTVPCGCGRRSVQISYSNNHEAIPYSWSMIVSIRLNHQNKHACSGTILSESYILTSASCLANASILGITIVAGIHNHSEDGGIFRKVDQIFLHPDYTGSIDDENTNDIAILHVSEALNFDNSLFISQICLPRKYNALPDSIDYPPPGVSLIVTGWGLMNCKNTTEEQLLQQFQVYSVANSHQNCYVLDKNQQIQFCAGLNNEDIVPSIRDPGSPIFQWFTDHWRQVGIATSKIDCTQFKSLGIYTRIIDYNDWIESIIKSSSASISTPPTTTTLIDTTTTNIAANTTTKPVKLPELYRCNQTSTCGCGAVPVVLTPARIVGGENAIDYSWPMMASLRWPEEDSHWCGGTILSNSYILTAAHCLYGYESDPPQDLTISVGMTNRTDVRQIRRTADHIYIYPNYTDMNDDFQNDIALVHISEPLEMKNNLFLTKTCVHPLDPTVSNGQHIKNGTSLMTIGWGALEEGRRNPPALLQQVAVYAIDNDDPICKDATNYSKEAFCAGLYEGDKDSCQGDSGGPIFRWTGNYWEQVGIVSHGEGCARPGKPGVYTRLSYYYDWIKDILKNNNEHLEPEFPFNEVSTTSTGPFNTTTTSTIDSNSSTTTTITNESNVTSTNNANNNYHANHLLFPALVVVFSMILQ